MTNDNSIHHRKESLRELIQGSFGADAKRVIIDPKKCEVIGIRRTPRTVLGIPLGTRVEEAVVATITPQNSDSKIYDEDRFYPIRVRGGYGFGEKVKNSIKYFVKEYESATHQKVEVSSL